MSQHTHTEEGHEHGDHAGMNKDLESCRYFIFNHGN